MNTIMLNQGFGVKSQITIEELQQYFNDKIRLMKEENLPDVEFRQKNYDITMSKLRNRFTNEIINFDIPTWKLIFTSLGFELEETQIRTTSLLIKIKQLHKKLDKVLLQ